MTTRFSFLSRQLTLLSSVLLVLFFAGICNADNYVVGPGDVLKIDVYDNPDLRTTVRVTDHGVIVMPLVGQIHVSGLTITEITNKLTTQLADGYIINPQVNIFMEEFRNKKAVVLGLVNRPGVIELRGQTTFLELISYAGGLQEGAGDTATIKRQQGDKQEVIAISIKSIIESGDLSQNIQIKDGDTVFIAKGNMCYVTGEVAKSDAYPCSESSTVLNLIALAGGFTAKASQSSVRIVRMVDGEKTVTKNVDLGTPVYANDIIVVPESFF